MEQTQIFKTIRKVLIAKFEFGIFLTIVTAQKNEVFH